MSKNEQVFETVKYIFGNLAKTAFCHNFWITYLQTWLNDHFVAKMDIFHSMSHSIDIDFQKFMNIPKANPWTGWLYNTSLINLLEVVGVGQWF